LRAAVKEFFSDSVIQRCLVHKERNIKGKLSKRRKRSVELSPV
jgi:transposase-like protein